MKQSEINIKVFTDEQNLPDSIQWKATEQPEDAGTQSKAMFLSFWDDEQQNVLKLDLWTKNMQVGEMKRFFLHNLGAQAQSLFEATGDQEMLDIVNKTIEDLTMHIKKEEEKQQ